MTELKKHETKAVEPVEPIGWFERMFDEWAALFPFRRDGDHGLGPGHRDQG